LSRIPLSMRDGWVLLFLLLALPTMVLCAEGTFQGRIVDPPHQERAEPGWIFVQGRNHMVRRVDVTRATIVPAPGMLSGPREKCGPECLAVGQEVRITAEQDRSGEWRAKRVEIVRAMGTVPSKTARPYGTLPWQIRGCWITTASRLRIQPLTEKSIITRWSGGIIDDVL